MTKYVGRVRSGQGDFAQWIERFQDVYAEVTGARLYPGTLNVELEADYTLPPSAWRVEAAKLGGRVRVSIVPCGINGTDAFLLRTDANENGTGDHGQNIVEIASAVRLRDALDLENGDLVELELP